MSRSISVLVSMNGMHLDLACVLNCAMTELTARISGGVLVQRVGRTLWHPQCQPTPEVSCFAVFLISPPQSHLHNQRTLPWLCSPLSTTSLPSRRPRKSCARQMPHA